MADLFSLVTFNPLLIGLFPIEYRVLHKIIYKKEEDDFSSSSFKSYQNNLKVDTNSDNLLRSYL